MGLKDYFHMTSVFVILLFLVVTVLSYKAGFNDGRFDGMDYICGDSGLVYDSQKDVILCDDGSYDDSSNDLYFEYNFSGVSVDG